MAIRLLLIFLAFAVGQGYAQRYFIDSIPAYSALPQCAVLPLSKIVRGMVSGCGDGGKTTSYSCFCTASSSRISSIISSNVQSACPTTTQGAADDALNVFSSYCALGAQVTPS